MDSVGEGNLTYWKFGEGYSYVTSTGKRGWASSLSGVPESAKGSSKTSPKKASPKPRRKTMAKKKKTTKRGTRFGNVGIKGALTGGASLLVANYALGGVGGEYSPAIQKIGAGLAAKTVGVGGASLIGAGVMEAAAILMARFLGGGAVFGGFGGGGAGSNGGYMY